MPKTGSVENLGPDAQKKVIELSVTGMSNQAIADQLNSEHNSEVTSDQVREYIRRNRSKMAQTIKADKNFQNQMVDTYFDTVKQLKELNGEMWKFFYEIRNNPEYKDKIITCSKCKHQMILQLQSYGLLLKTADTLLKQIDHVDKVLGKMQKKTLNVTYNYVDLSRKLTTVMPELLEGFEKRGLIEMKKKKMKIFVENQS